MPPSQGMQTPATPMKIVPAPKQAPLVKPPSTIAPRPTPGTVIMPQPPSPPAAAPSSSQTLQQYIMGGMNVSMKMCVEGQGSITSLLQKVCSSYPDISPEEQQVCHALPSLTQGMEGVDLDGSLCVVKSVPLAQVGQQVCANAAPDKRAACLSVFGM